jgi:hypothetical protein
MVWWQYLIISLASAGVGYGLSRLGARAEKDALERRQLQNAVKGLLTEMNANLKLVEKGPDIALLPPLAKDMWNIHKSRIVELPSEMQTCLYEAYVRIDYVNAVLDIRADVGTRGLGPGAWDERYRDEAKRARGPMGKAREELKKWLAERAIESRGEMLMKHGRMSKLKHKLKPTSEHIWIVFACILIGIGFGFMLRQFALGIGLVSLGVALIGLGIATKSDNRMRAMADLQFDQALSELVDYYEESTAWYNMYYHARGALHLARWATEERKRELKRVLKEVIVQAKTEKETGGLVSAIEQLWSQYEIDKWPDGD